MKPDNLLQELKRFESNIEIHDSLKVCSKEHIQSLIDRRTRDIDADCLDDDLERLRTHNLLSFFYFAIDNKVEAVRHNGKALEIDGGSINALTCRAYYYLIWADFYESEKQLLVLKSTEHNRVAKLVAKAEVAYAYTKIGIEHFQKAAEKFEEVLGDCSGVPKRYVCSWKFSWALAIRRQSNFGNASRNCNLSDTETYLQKAEMLYNDIITMKETSIKRYKARAYVDLGLEIYFKRDKQTAKKQYEQTDHCIEQACSLEPEDDFVLSRCGRYFRLISNHEKAIDLLRRAIAIKETSFSYHHLALALRDSVKITRRDGASGYLSSDSTSTSAACEDDKKQPITESHHSKCNTNPMENNGISSRSERNQHATHLPSRHPNRELQRTEFHTYSPKEIHFCKLIKSPGKVHFFPPEKAGEILQCLDKAFKLNNNIAALYDKGLLLRRSEQYTKAVAVFMFMLKEPSSSFLLLADAYEQAARCLLDEAEQDPTKTDRNQYNAKIFLGKAIELSNEMISRIPDLKKGWKSHQTLRSLLLREERTKENLRELAALYTKDKNMYPKGKDIYEKLIQHEENNEKKVDVMVDLFNASLLHEHYDDAIMAMYGILPNDSVKIDTEKCVRALIKGGIAAWQKNEETIAKKRLKAALNIREFGQHTSKEVSESERSYDIFVLSSDISEEMARPVSKLLQKFGPSVTLNSDIGMPGQHITEVMTEAINRSKYTVVFLATEDEEKDLKRMQVMFTDSSMKTSITISELDRAAKDPIYCRLPSVPYRNDMFSSTDNITEQHVSWVENFLFTLTGVNPIMST